MQRGKTKGDDMKKTYTINGEIAETKKQTISNIQIVINDIKTEKIVLQSPLIVEAECNIDSPYIVKTYTFKTIEKRNAK